LRLHGGRLARVWCSPSERRCTCRIRQLRMQVIHPLARHSQDLGSWTRPEYLTALSPDSPLLVTRKGQAATDNCDSAQLPRPSRTSARPLGPGMHLYPPRMVFPVSVSASTPSVEVATNSNRRPGNLADLSYLIPETLAADLACFALFAQPRSPRGPC
jgi:hypothetical protein